MFFIKKLKHTIVLHPSYFGPQTQPYLENKLHADVEGTCTGKHGYIISVIGILENGNGNIQSGTGMAEFEVEYNAIVFKPFKGEIVEGVVGNVNKMGFFTEVGPLQIFVSTHLIPADMKFDSGTNPRFVSTSTTGEEEGVVEKNSKVRLKIVGTRVDATEIFAIGTIKEDFLGPIVDV